MFLADGPFDGAQDRLRRWWHRRKLWALKTAARMGLHRSFWVFQNLMAEALQQEASAEWRQWPLDAAEVAGRELELTPKGVPVEFLKAVDDMLHRLPKPVGVSAFLLRALIYGPHPDDQEGKLARTDDELRPLLQSHPLGAYQGYYQWRKEGGPEKLEAFLAEYRPDPDRPVIVVAAHSLGKALRALLHEGVVRPASPYIYY